MVQVTPPDGRDSGAESLGRRRAHQDRERNLVRLGWLINFRLRPCSRGRWFRRVGSGLAYAPSSSLFCGPRTEPKPDSTANSASFRDCIGVVTTRMQFLGIRPVVVLVEFLRPAKLAFPLG